MSESVFTVPADKANGTEFQGILDSLGRMGFTDRGFEKGAQEYDATPEWEPPGFLRRTAGFLQRTADAAAVAGSRASDAAAVAGSRASDAVASVGSRASDAVASVGSRASDAVSGAVSGVRDRYGAARDYAFAKAPEAPPKPWFESNQGKALIGGVGVASAAAIMYQMAVNKRRRAIRDRMKKTNRDAIVLQLPREVLQRNKRASDDVAGVDVKGPEVTDKQLPLCGVRHARAAKAALREKRKAEDVVMLSKVAIPRQYREALQALKVVAAFGVGYAGVNALHRKVVANQLQADEDASRNEYLDRLIPAKTAEADIFDEIFIKDADFEKEAMSLGAMMALVSMALAGGTAYVTQDMLGAHADQRNKSFDPPRMPATIGRVIFKSEPGSDEPDEETDAKGLKVAMIIKMAELSGREDELLAYVKQALIADGVDFDELEKSAQFNTGYVRNSLKWLSNSRLGQPFANAAINWGAKAYPGAARGEMNKKLIAGLQNWSQSNNPFKAFIGTAGNNLWPHLQPLLKKWLPDRAIQSGIADQLGTGRGKDIRAKGVDTVIDGAKRRAQGVFDGVKNRFSGWGKQDAPGGDGMHTDGSAKTAAIGVPAGIVGGIIADRLGRPTQSAPPPPAAPVELSSAQLRQLADQIQIEGADEEAQGYVDENRDDIRLAIKQLIRDNKL